MRIPPRTVLALWALSLPASALTIPVSHRSTTLQEAVQIGIGDQVIQTTALIPWLFEVEGHVDTDALTWTLDSWSLEAPSQSLVVETEPFDLSVSKTEIIDPPGFEPPYEVVTQVDFDDITYEFRWDWEPNSGSLRPAFWTGYQEPTTVVPIDPGSLTAVFLMGSIGSAILRQKFGEEERFPYTTSTRALLYLRCDDIPLGCQTELLVQLLASEPPGTFFLVGNYPDGSFPDALGISATGTLRVGPDVPEPAAGWLLLATLMVLRAARRVLGLSAS